jgi:Flp pilus assembly protein TadD
MNAIAQAKTLIDDIRQHRDRFTANLEAAERILVNAAKIEPQNVEVLTCLGAVLSDRGKHLEAAGVLLKAIGAGSQDRNTYFNLAVALINSATHAEAMSYFRRAKSLESSPQTWEAYFDPQSL